MKGLKKVVILLAVLMFAVLCSNTIAYSSKINRINSNGAYILMAKDELIDPEPVRVMKLPSA